MIWIPSSPLKQDEQGTASMRFNAANDSTKDTADDQSFFFGVDGRLGLGKRSEETLKLDVAGFAGLQGRVGTYATGEVPADGKWHTILEGLDNCSAFEVVARTGKKGTGKFAILHAFALSAFGNSRSRIRKTSAALWFFSGIS